MDKKALLIEWDPNTGKRAGDVNPRDPNLQCNAWQNMDVTPAVELRLVEDDRDMVQYEGDKGITVLHGIGEINEAICKNFTSKFVIDDEILYAAHMKKIADKIDFDKLPDNREKCIKYLKEHYKIKGIREIKPQKMI